MQEKLKPLPGTKPDEDLAAIMGGQRRSSPSQPLPVGAIGPATVRGESRIANMQLAIPAKPRVTTLYIVLIMIAGLILSVAMQFVAQLGASKLTLLSSFVGIYAIFWARFVVFFGAGGPLVSRVLVISALILAPLIAVGQQRVHLAMVRTFYAENQIPQWLQNQGFQLDEEVYQTARRAPIWGTPEEQGEFVRMDMDPTEMTQFEEACVREGLDAEATIRVSMMAGFEAALKNGKTGAARAYLNGAMDRFWAHYSIWHAFATVPTRSLFWFVLAVSLFFAGRKAAQEPD